MLIGLRENKHSILYTACGDVVPISIIKNLFTLKVFNRASHNILSKSSNNNLIKKLLKSLGVEANVKFVLEEDKKQDNKIEEVLKQKFGNMLNIIE